MPFHRYAAFVPVDRHRTAPGPTRRSPRRRGGCSTDLRDGNQALIDPMSPARKLKMFELLVDDGLQGDRGRVPCREPDRLRLRPAADRRGPDPRRRTRSSVLTQAREDLIERTVESLVGADKATVHLYNATAPLFRRVVFGVDKAECIGHRHPGHRVVMKYAEQHPRHGTDFGYEYSPEIFTDTELDFAVEVCERSWTSGSPTRGPRDHPQPAGHRRDGDAERLRRPDRVDSSRHADPPGARRDLAAPAQRPRHRGRRRPSWP